MPQPVIQDLSNNIAPGQMASFESEVFGGSSTPPPDNTPPTPIIKPATPTPQEPATPQGTPQTTPNNNEQNPSTASIADFKKILGGEAFVKVEGAPTTTTKPVVPNTNPAQPNNQQPPEPDGRPARNLAPFGEQEQKWLQRMPYDAYEYFSKAILEKREFTEKQKAYETQLNELKSGKQQIPQNYYEHPQAAYALPEVAQLQQQLQQATDVENHWAEQLAIVEEGLALKALAKARGETEPVLDKKWFTLGANEKGELIYAGEQEINTNAKAYILRQMNNAQLVGHNTKNTLQNTLNNFKQQYSTVVSKVKEAAKTYMPIFEDTKGEDYKVVEQVMPKVLEMGITKENPAYEILAKSIAFNVILRNMLLSTMQSNTTQQGIQDDRRRAGPGGADFNSAGNITTAPSVKLSDFNKLL
jgi:hypothetical protein